MSPTEVIAREAAGKISEWEAKTYGKPGHSFPSTQKEIEVLKSIIHSAITKALVAEKNFIWPVIKCDLCHQSATIIRRTGLGASALCDRHDRLVYLTPKCGFVRSTCYTYRANKRHARCALRDSP